MSKRILLLNGPNLNLLGTREPEVYGDESLADIEARLIDTADAGGALVTCIQSNAEHELVDAVHQAKLLEVDFIVINPGAFTHTSIALRDALLGSPFPLSKCICPMFTRGKNFGITPISVMWPLALLPVWVRRDMTLPWIMR